MLRVRPAVWSALLVIFPLTAFLKWGRFTDIGPDLGRQLEPSWRYTSHLQSPVKPGTLGNFHLTHPTPARRRTEHRFGEEKEFRRHGVKNTKSGAKNVSHSAPGGLRGGCQQVSATSSLQELSQTWILKHGGQ
ncbi:hypothetical protein CYMTET_12387, partial [Cymbomonas tetramitiformis]